MQFIVNTKQAVKLASEKLKQYEQLQDAYMNNTLDCILEHTTLFGKPKYKSREDARESLLADGDYKIYKNEISTLKIIKNADPLLVKYIYLDRVEYYVLTHDILLDGGFYEY